MVGRIVLSLAAIAGLVTASGVARAATYTWTQTAAGTYGWTTTSNWLGDAAGYPGVVGDVANLNLNLTAAQTINLLDAIRLGTLNLGDTSSPFIGATLSAAGGSLIMDVVSGSAAISKSTAGNLATDTIAANILLADNLLVTNSATNGAILISGSIGGAGLGLTKDGVGLLVLSGTNGYTGATTINAGTLQVGYWGTTGALSTSSAIGGSAGATLSFARSNNVTQGTDFASVIGGAINLTQAGSGALILNGANTYTGTTTVMGSGTLQIGAGGAAGSIDSSSPLVLGGSLGGGTLFLNRSPGVTQAFAGTTLNPGASSGTAAAGNTINFGAITRNVGSTLNIATTGTYLTSTLNNANGILGSGIVYGGTSWAVATSGTIQPLASGSYTTTTSIGATASSYTNANIDVTSSAGTLSGAITPNSIRFHTTATSTVTFAANTLNTVANGILITSNVGNNSSLITGGTIAGSAGGDLVVINNNTQSSGTIASVIANNGSATALTKSGAGTLVLTASNSYSGGTYLNAGTLTLSNGGALGTGQLTINGGTLNVKNGAFTTNNNIVANASFSVAGDNASTTGTGSFRISRPITITGGGGNDAGIAEGLTVGGVITDMNGGNTLNAFDVTWNMNGAGTTSITLGGAITLRDNQRLNAIGLSAVHGVVSVRGNIGDGGNGYGLTFVNGGAPAPYKEINRGPGVFLLGTNTYTGATTIDPGAVVGLGKNNTMGSLSPSSAIINNGIFWFYRSNNITQGTDFGTITGGGQVMQAGGGTTILTAANTFAGATVVTGGVLQIGTGGTTGSISTVGVAGALTGGAIAFNRSNAVSQGVEFGSIVGPVGVNQVGSGTLTLNGPNAFTGRASAAAGTISLDHNLALQTAYIDTGSNGVFSLGSGVTTPWIGGLQGSKNLSSSITGNYSQLTSLTLNVSVASTYSAVIADGATPLNVTKLGTQTQILTGSSTYTGTTTIVNGQLQLGNNGSTGSLSASSPVVLAGGTLTFSRNNLAVHDSVISGAGFLLQNQSGGVALTAANTFLGQTTISSGSVVIGNGGATGSLSASGVIINNATLVVNRSNNVAQGTDFSSQSIYGTGGLTKLGAGNLTLNTPNWFSGNTLISGGRVVLGDAAALQWSAYDTTGSNGTIGLDVNGNAKPKIGGLAGGVALATAITGYSGVTELILNPQGGKTPSYSGVIADGAAGMNLTKDGFGTQTLTGSLAYTGTTTIRNGTLTVNRQTTGALNATSPLTFTAMGGTFNMDNTGATGALSQSLGALTFSGGDGTVRETNTATRDQLITFSSLAARSAGATGNFSLSSGSPSSTNGFVLTGQSSGVIGNGFFYNGGASTATYAYYDSTGFVRGINYGTDPGTATTAGGTALTTGSTDVQTTGTISAQGTDTFNTIRIQNTANSAQAFTQSAASILTVNGILRAGNGGASSTTTISGGTLQPGLNAELVIRTDMSGDLLTISSPIVANGNNALTKSGGGTLTLSASNSHTGGTYMNGGTLYLGNPRAVGTGTFTINSGTLSGMNGLTFPNNNVILVTSGSVHVTPLQSWNFGTGQFRISQPIFYTSVAQATGDNTALPNLITDGTGGNTLNALDISWKIDQSTSNTSLTAPITLRDNQIVRVWVNHVTSRLNFAGAMGDGGNGYGVTWALIPGGQVTYNSTYTSCLSISATNTYSGPTTINPGVSLSLGSSSTDAGALNPASLIVNNGRFINSRSSTVTQGTHFGQISGIGEVTVKAGTMVLNNSSNSFAGPLAVYGGTLRFDSIQNAGVNSSIGAYPAAVATSIILGDGNSSGGILSYTGATASSNRGFTLGNTSTIDVATAGATLTLGDSIISGGFTLNVTGGANSRLNVSTLTVGGAATLSPTTAGMSVGSVFATTFSSLTLGGTSVTGTVSGDIALGGGSLIKSGAGRWTLSGLSTAGTTSIQAGTLAITGTGALWATSPVDLTASGATFDVAGISASSATVGALSGSTGSFLTLGGKSLTFGNAVSTVFSGSISGVGSNLTKQGSGTTTLSGVNTFSGTTRIAAGTLAISNTLALQNSTLDMNSADSGTVDFAQNATLGGLTGSRSLNMDGFTVSVGANGANSTYSGAFFNGALTKVGSGTLTLTGTSTYSGATAINAGALRIGDGGTAGALPSATAITGSSGGTLIFNRSDAYGGAYGGVISGNMGVRLASGTLVLTGSNAYGGATTIDAGILQIGNGGTTGALSTSSSITGSAGAVFAVNRSDTVTQGIDFNSQITGAIGITQLGSGTLVLTGPIIGNNNYTGGTRIANGTLQLGSGNGKALPNYSGVTFGTGSTSGILDLAAFETTLGSLAFDGTGSQVVPGGKLNLQVLSGSAGITVNSGSHAVHPDTSLLSNTLVTMAANSFLSLHGVIDGAGSLRQVGSGTVSIYGANTYEGGTFLDGGYMSVENSSALGGGTVTISGNSILNLNDHVVTNAIVFGSGSGAVINAGALVSVSGTYSITSGTGSEITTSYSVEAESDISFVSGLASTVYVRDAAVGEFTADVLSTGDVNVNAGGRGIFSGGVAGNVLTTGSSLFAGGVTGNVTVQGGTASFTTTTGSVSAVNVNNGVAVFTGTIGGVAHATAAAATLEIRGPVLSTADVNAEAGGTVKLMGNGSFAGPTLDNNGVVIVDRTADLALAAVMSGSGSLTKSDATTLTLSGNNSYTGGTLLTGGTVRAGSATALGTGPVVLNSGVLDINGQSLSIGPLSGSAATSVVSGVAGPAGLTTQVAGDSTFAGVIGNGSGTVSLTKTGAGRLTLTAAQTFSGAAIISGGTLALDTGAALASQYIKAGAAANDGGTLDVTALGGGLTLTNGQKLGGYGTVLGDVVIGSGAILAPGGSIGTLTESGSMTWAGGGNYLFEIFNAGGTAAGTDWDLFVVDLLGITASGTNKFVIDLQTLATGTAQSAGLMPGGNWNASSSYQWKFVETTSTTFSESNFDASWFVFNQTNFLNDTTGGTFSVARGGEGGLGGDTTASQLYIIYAAVPEPGTLTLAGIGLAAAAWTLRRRRRRAARSAS